MAAINPTITITFADTGTPVLTATEVAELTAKIMALMTGRTVAHTYGTNTLALAVT